MGEQIPKYVLGFLFYQYYPVVYLIEKKRPEWQKEMFNGFGGKIEEGESPLEAIKREASEELSNSDTFHYMHCFTMICNFGVVWVYKVSTNCDEVISLEDEQGSWFDVKSLPEMSIPNIRWMIAMMDSSIKFPLSFECSDPLK